MRFIRNALIVGGLFFGFLFLLPGNAYSQLISPHSYLFVEVKDTNGQKVTDATVAVTTQLGKSMFNAKTNEMGMTETRIEAESSDHQYNFNVSKPGYLTSENVFFLSACCRQFNSIWLVGNLTDYMLRREDHKPPPIRVVLTKIPETAEERRIAESEDRKYQFFLAIKRGERDAVDRLLRAGVNANAVDSDNTPAIAWAVFAGNGEIIKLLLAAGADVRNTKSIGNQSLLIYFIPRNGKSDKDRQVEQYDEIVQSLIKTGAAVDIKSPRGGPVLNNAVRMSSCCFSPETIRLLISSGADVKALDQCGQPILMAATSSKFPEIIRMLVKAGAPIDAKDSEGRTPLMVAAGDNSHGAEFVKLFLELGADPRLTNRYGEIALDIARRSHTSEDVISLLEQASRRP